MCIRVHPGHPRAAQLDQDQLRGHKSQDFIDLLSAIIWLKGGVEEQEKVTKKFKKEVAIAKEEVL